jgi:hypothetical protein
MAANSAVSMVTADGWMETSPTPRECTGNAGDASGVPLYINVTSDPPPHAASPRHVVHLPAPEYKQAPWPPHWLRVGGRGFDPRLQEGGGTGHKVKPSVGGFDVGAQLLTARTSARQDTSLRQRPSGRLL